MGRRPSDVLHVAHPPILKAYLDRFRREVQRYFPVPAGSPAQRFALLTVRYPAYELLPWRQA